MMDVVLSVPQMIPAVRAPLTCVSAWSADVVTSLTLVNVPFSIWPFTVLVMSLTLTAAPNAPFSLPIVN
ncbi:MAG: hypothetical protein BWY66_00277 [bacterium ADurb.Bin374]|nr:MAG: hypothetical protein BWY66_00277 [bacterium ADurb.Bin374]